MVEQFIVFGLKKLLGDFVEDGDKLHEKIQIGVWSGKAIIFEDLILKNSILSMVDVPITLCFGSIGKFELLIPWKTLGKDPIVINIDKINILVKPKYEWNPGAADKREQSLKQYKLAAAELFAAKRLIDKPTNSWYDLAKNWFMAPVINKIIDNIEVNIRNVHFRYEDEVSCPSKFCIGMSFETLRVHTRDMTDSTYEEHFPTTVRNMNHADANSNYDKYEIKTNGADSFFKVIEMTSLAVYWNPLVNETDSKKVPLASNTFTGRPSIDILDYMQRTLATGRHKYVDRPQHHYILLPTDIHTYLEVSLNPGTGVTKANVKVFMSSISIALEDRQLREIISMSTNLSNFAKLERFSEYRPKANVVDDPAGWWRYAINAVLIQIRIDRKKSMSLSQLAKRWADRAVYVELWKSRLVSPSSIVNQLSNVDNAKRTVDRESPNGVYRIILNKARADLKTEHNRKVVVEPVIQVTGGMKVTSNMGSVQKRKKSFTNAVIAREVSAASSAPTSSIPSLPLTPEGLEVLKSLEYDLSFEDIIQFRSQAERYLSQEVKKSSWLGTLSSWFSAGKNNTESEEDRAKLYEALRYDPDRVFRGGNKEVDLFEVMANVSVTLKKGAVTLALSTPDVTSSSLPFLKLELNEMKSKNIIMGDGSHVKVFVSLQDFEAFEVLSSATKTSKFTPETVYKKFVFRRTFAHEHQYGSFNGSVTDSMMNDDTRSVMSTSMRSTASRMSPKDQSKRNSMTAILPPLFTSSIDIFPPNKEKDTAVSLVLEELEVWISPFATWTDPMAAFVTWPEDLKYWSEMEMTALNQLADFKSRIDAKLEYMMNNHSNVVIEAKVKAPVIIVTDSEGSDDNSDVLVVDLGLITLKTEKLAKATRQKVLDTANTGGFTSDATGSIRPPSSQNTPAKSTVRKKVVQVNKQVAVSADTSLQQASVDASMTTSIVNVEMDIERSLLATDDFELVPNNGAITVSNEDVLTPLRPPSGRRNTSISDLDIDDVSFEERDEYGFQNTKGTRRSSVGDYQRKFPNGTPSLERDTSHVTDVSNSYYGQQVHTPTTGAAKSVAAEEGEHDLSEEDLFDVFLCRVKDSEIYLISSAMVHNVHAEVDPNKTVIVDKNEITIEIQVSVLPWDTTLPPVKLFVDIEEITVQLSEAKLLRLNQFAVGLVNRSNTIISSNLKSINRLSDAIKRRSLESSRLRGSMGGSIGGGPYNASRLSTGSSFRVNRVSNVRSQMSSVMGDDNTFFDAKSEFGGAAGSMRGDTSDRMSVSSSSRLRKLVESGKRVVSDGEDSDDGSFFSVEQNYSSKDRTRQADSLAHEISQHESTKLKLMSDIRVTEGDISKAMQCDALKQELALCEQQLRQLHERYVQLRMHTNELEEFNNASALDVSNTTDGLHFNEKQLQARKELANQLSLYDRTHVSDDQGHKRNLIHASVFKITQEPNQFSNADVKYKPTDERLSEFANKKLVYAKVNIVVINVDMMCATQASEDAKRVSKSSNRPTSQANRLSIPLPALNKSIVIRTRLTGLFLTLKHKAMDSKVLFVLHQVDLQDYTVYTSSIANDTASHSSSAVPGSGLNRSGYRDFNNTVLISSEPSTFGMFGVPMADKFLQGGNADMLRVKYEVIYADDPVDVDRLDNYNPNASHTVQVTSGFLGINIEQQKIAIIIATADSIATNISAQSKAIPQQLPTVTIQTVAPISTEPTVVTVSNNESTPLIPATESVIDPLSSETLQFISEDSSKLKKDHDEPSQTVNESTSTALPQLPHLVLNFKMDCISISLLSRSEPLLTSAIWGIGATVYSRTSCVSSTFRIADVTMDYFAPEKTSEHTSTSILCRQLNSSASFLSLESKFELDEEHIHMPDLSVSLKTVPIALTVDLECVKDVTEHALKGPVAVLMKKLSKQSATKRTIPEKKESRSDHGNSACNNCSPLDKVLNPLLDICNGSVNMLIGDILVTVPSIQVDTLQSVDLTVSISAVEGHTLWGDSCVCGGLESSLMVRSIEMRMGEYHIVDPFDVCVLVVTLPQIFLAPYSVMGIASSLKFPTEYVPMKLPFISKNELQLSVSVSPIHLHVHDKLIVSAREFASNTTSVLQRITSLVQSTASDNGNNTLLDLLQKTRLVCDTMSPLSLGFTVTSSVLLYEAAVIFDVGQECFVSNNDSSNGIHSPRRTSRRNGDSGSTTPKVRGSIARQPSENSLAYSVFTFDSSPYVPGDKLVSVFRFVTRQIEFKVSVNDVLSDGEHVISISDPALLLAIHSLEADSTAQSFAEITVSIDTMDFEHLNTATLPYKRMLCNAPVASTPLCEDSLSLSDSSSPGKGKKCVSMSIDLSAMMDVSVDMTVSNLHTVVVADSIVALLALVNAYQSAVEKPLVHHADIRPSPSKSFHFGLDSTRSSTAGSRAEPAAGTGRRSVGGGSGSQQRDSAFAHPSSTPMSTTSSFAPTSTGKSSSDDSDDASPLLIAMLHRQSFALPLPLRSLTVKMTLEGLYTWIPSGDKGAKELALCCSIDKITLQTSHHKADWVPYAQLKESYTSQLIWTSQININGFALSLNNSMPDEICIPVGPLSSKPVDEEDSDNCWRVPPKNTDIHTIIIVPFDIQVQHAIEVSIRREVDVTRASMYQSDIVLFDSSLGYDLTQKVSVLLQDISIYCYLDYKPLLKLYEYASTPLKDYFTQTKGARQPVTTKNTDRISFDSPTKKTKTASEDTKVNNEMNAKEYNTLNSLTQDKRLTVIDNIFNVLAVLPALSSLSFTISQDRIAVYVVNDIYKQQPVTIARVAIEDLDVHMFLSKPIREVCTIVCIDKQSVSNDSTSSGQVILSTSNDSPSNGNNRFGFGSNLGLSTLSAVQELRAKLLRGLESSALLPPSPLNIEAAKVTDAPVVNMLTVKAHSTIRADYYNQRLIASEPLIEPFMTEISFNLPFSSTHTENPVVTFINDMTVSTEWAVAQELEQELTAVLVKQCLRSPDQELEGNNVSKLNTPPCLQLNIIDNLNVNLTVSLCELAFVTLKAVKSLDDTADGENDSYSSLLSIMNDCGLPLKFWTRDYARSTDLPARTQLPILLADDETARYHLVKRECWYGSGNTASNRSLHVAIQRPAGDHFPSLLDIPLEGVGCRLFVLDVGGHGVTKSPSTMQNKLRSSVPTSGTHRPSSSTASVVTAISTPNSTIVALELVSRGGVKTLIVRSTARLVNSTRIALRVELVCGFRNTARETLWTTQIQPGASVAVPAHLCNIEKGRFIVKPLLSIASFTATQRPRRSDVFSAELPMPDILGAKKKKSKDDDPEHDADAEDGENYNFSANKDKLPRNFIIWRKQMSASKGSADTLSYSHWVHFNKNNMKSTDPVNRDQWDLFTYCQEKAESMCCNAEVVSKGIPRTSKTQSADACMLRTLNFKSAVTIVNLTAHSLEVGVVPNLTRHIGGQFESLDTLYKANRHLVNVIPTSVLQSGDSWDCMSYHSSETIQLSLKQCHDTTSIQKEWSTFVIIPGCRAQSTEVITYPVNLRCKNGSTLQLQVEVKDEFGSRNIHIYAPYWIVTSSFIPVQYQHETRTESSALNGVDNLAADQEYDDPNSLRFKAKQKAVDNNNNVTSKNTLSKSQQPIVLGKSRGTDGVILGPSSPLRGLADVLKPANSAVLSRFSLHKQELVSLSTGTMQKFGNSAIKAIDNRSVTSDAPSTTNTEFTMAHESPYRLMQCGFSGDEKQNGSLRLRSRDSNWSSYFSLDRVGTSAITLKTTSVSAEERDSTTKETSQNFDFGIWTTVAEAPFQRTKIVVVVDRLLLVNSIDQSIEVKQTGQNNVFHLKPGGETPLWWSNGLQHVHVRLARNGWLWSGKFSVTKEGEVPLRLRSEIDNTVYFLLVEVLRQGPRVCIVFKGGEQFSPYRFENHTLETFRVRQSGQGPIMTLLPYHSSAYAWDEPLSQHSVSVEVAKGSASSTEEWSRFGTFTFDRLEIVDRKTKDNNEHLVVCVMAQGPTRVLHISDSRSAAKSVDPKATPRKSKRYSLQSLLQADIVIPPQSVVRSVLFHVLVNISGVGVSVVDQKPEELMYISMLNASVDLTVGDGFMSLNADLERFQIDNQLPYSPFPSLFYPLLPFTGIDLTAMNKSRASLSAGIHNPKEKFMSLSVTQDFMYAGVIFIPMMRVTLSPCDVNIELSIAARLYEMAKFVTALYQETNSATDSIKTARCENSDLVLQDDTDKNGKEVYGTAKKHLRAFPTVGKESSGNPANATKKHAVPKLTVPSVPTMKQWTDALSTTEPSKHETNKSNNENKKKAPTLAHQRIRKLMVSVTVLQDRVHKPSTKVYIQQMVISAIRMNISVDPSGASSLNSGEGNLILSTLKQVLISMGSTLAKLDNCPIKFYSVSLDHFYGSDSELLQVILNKYKGQAVAQSVNVILSSELLGNPLMLWRTLSEGVVDFIRMPYDGFREKSVQAVVFGVYRGTSSLLRRTFASVFTFAGHLTTVGQTGLLTLGVVEPSSRVRTNENARDRGDSNLLEMDDNVVAIRETSTGRPVNTASVLPSNVISGLGFAVTQFVPDIQAGYYVHGPRGALSGVFKGFIGLGARPLYGALGSLSSTLNSMSFHLLPRFHAAQKLNLQRTRPPRCLHSPNLPLQIYSAEENIGTELLLRVHQGEYYREGYVHHTRLKDGHQMIVTRMRVLVVNESFEFCELLWQCPLQNILSIEIVYDRVINIANNTIHTLNAVGLLRNKSRNKNGVCKFTSQLSGEPSLHLYYRPTATELSRSSSKTNSPAKQSSSNSASHHPREYEPAGLRCTHRALYMQSHDQLLAVLYQLLRLSRKLLSGEVLTYLSDAGVDDELVASLQNDNYRGGQVFLRSPTGRKMNDASATTTTLTAGSLSDYGGSDDIPQSPNRSIGSPRSSAHSVGRYSATEASPTPTTRTVGGGTV